MDINETSPKKVRILIALLLVGVFFAGAVTGAGVLHWLVRPPVFGPSSYLPGPFADLGLSKDQETKVLKVFDKHRPELDAILHETFPKARKVFDAIDNDMRVFLTAEQQKKLNQVRKRIESFPPMGAGPIKGPHGSPPFGPPPGLPPGAPPGSHPQHFPGK
jgi:hypothetical protein